MVWIQKQHIEAFPKFTQFVLTQVVEVAGFTFLTEAMLEAALEPAQRTAANKAELLKALCPGTPPLIFPSVQTGLDNNIPAKYGFQETSIYIYAGIVEKFEKDHHLAAAQKYMMATILHELVHHTDYAADKRFRDYEIVDGQTKRKDPNMEMGDIFEQKAFGQKLKGWWL